MRFLIAGDFNINMSRQSSLGQSLEDLTSEFGLCILGTDATRVSPDSATTIDLLITPSGALPSITGQCPGFADHETLFACFDHGGLPSLTSPTYSFRDFNNVDSVALGRDCGLYDWSPVYGEPNLDLASSYFAQGLYDLFALHVPLRTKVSRALDVQVFSDPAVIRARRWAFQAYCQWRRSHTRDDYLAFRRFRRNAEYIYRSKLRKRMEKYFDGPIDWRRCRCLGLGRSKHSSLGPDPNEYADHLAYSEGELAMGVEDSSNDLHLESTNGFTFSGCSEIQVVAAFSRLKPCSVGSDGLPLKFLVLVLPHILPIITHLFNRCLSAAHFPMNWKRGVITPVPKCRSPTSLDDWRPITVLPILAKAFEYLILEQMSSWVSSQGFLSDLQSGFRSGHSTSTALARVSYDIRRFIDDGDHALLVLLDLKRAFDSVPHSLLIRKLNQNFAFDTSACNLVHSFLGGRTRAVKGLSVVSPFREVRFGVPQGSVLAPLLFSLFIDDITRCLDGLGYHLYADDLQLYLSLPRSNPQRAISRLNTHISLLVQWCGNNGLFINPHKSQALIISATNLPENYISALPQPLIDGTLIPFTTSPVRNLGILFDRRLSWTDHVRSQCAKIYRGLRTLYAVSNHVPVRTRLSLVKALLLPHLFYGAIVIFPLQAGLMLMLERALKACIRYVFKLRRFSSTSAFRHNLVPCSLNVWMEIKALQFLFRLNKGYCPDYLSQLVNRSNRMPNRFLLPLTRSSFGLNTIFGRGLSLWNALPADLRDLPSLKAFTDRILTRYNLE